MGSPMGEIRSEGLVLFQFLFKPWARKRETRCCKQNKRCGGKDWKKYSNPSNDHTETASCYQEIVLEIFLDQRVASTRSSWLSKESLSISLMSSFNACASLVPQSLSVL